MPGRSRNCAEQRRERGQTVDPCQGDAAGRGQSGKRAGHAHERQLRQDQRLAAIVAIRDDAADQTEQKERHEPHQPEQSKVKRVARELEHLPGDRHALDLGAGLGENLRAPDEAEIAVAQHPEGALVTRRRLGGGLASAHRRRLCRTRRATVAGR